MLDNVGCRSIRVRIYWDYICNHSLCNRSVEYYLTWYRLGTFLPPNYSGRPVPPHTVDTYFHADTPRRLIFHSQGHPHPSCHHSSVCPLALPYHCVGVLNRDDLPCHNRHDHL
jgi:hypothetical protein